MTDRCRAIIFLCHFADYYVHTARRGQLFVATVDGVPTEAYIQSLQASDQSVSDAVSTEVAAFASPDIARSTSADTSRRSLFAFLWGLVRPKRLEENRIEPQPVTMRRRRRPF